MSSVLLASASYLDGIDTQAFVATDAINAVTLSCLLSVGRILKTPADPTTLASITVLQFLVLVSPSTANCSTNASSVGGAAAAACVSAILSAQNATVGDVTQVVDQNFNTPDAPNPLSASLAMYTAPLAVVLGVPASDLTLKVTSGAVVTTLPIPAPSPPPSPNTPSRAMAVEVGVGAGMAVLVCVVCALCMFARWDHGRPSPLSSAPDSVGGVRSTPGTGGLSRRGKTTMLAMMGPKPPLSPPPVVVGEGGEAEAAAVVNNPLRAGVQAPPLSPPSPLPYGGTVLSFRDSAGVDWHLDGPGGRILALGWRRVDPTVEGWGDVYYIHSDGAMSDAPVYLPDET